jgi:hypothetical protein
MYRGRSLFAENAPYETFKFYFDSHCEKYELNPKYCWFFNCRNQLVEGSSTFNDMIAAKCYETGEGFCTVRLACFYLPATFITRLREI